MSYKSIQICLAIFTFLGFQRVNAENICCQDVQDNICYTDPCQSGILNNKVLIGAGVVSAAVLGAVIGANSVNSKHHHSGGCKCPSKVFIKDTGETLSFSFAVTIDPEISGPNPTILLNPFVRGPDDAVYTSEQINATAGGTFISPFITISDPLFGYYEFGYVLQGLDANGTFIDFKFPGGDFIVNSSRLGNIETHASSGNLNVFFTDTPGLHTVQMNVPFSYAKTGN